MNTSSTAVSSPASSARPSRLRRWAVATVAAGTVAAGTVVAGAAPASAAGYYYTNTTACFGAPGMAYTQDVILFTWNGTGWTRLGAYSPNLSGCLTLGLSAGYYFKFLVASQPYNLICWGDSGYWLQPYTAHSIAKTNVNCAPSR